MLDLALYTGVATGASIGPVYKIRKGLAKIFKIPLLGITLSLAYGGVTSLILLKLFAFQSSVAGLANLLSSLIFTGWMWMESKKV